MIEPVGSQLGEDGSHLREFFVATFDGGFLPELPWQDAPFDCVLISADDERTRSLAATFAEQIVHRNVIWVQTTGPHAEWIHDLVDLVSVQAGRQQKVGDGNPMTSWHSDAISMNAMPEVAYYCHGGADFVLCLVLGDLESARRFRSALEQLLNTRD